MLTLIDLKNMVEKETTLTDPIFSTSVNRSLLNNLLLGEEASSFISMYTSEDIHSFDREVFNLVTNHIPQFTDTQKSKQLFELIKNALISLPAVVTEELTVF